MKETKVLVLEPNESFRHLLKVLLTEIEVGKVFLTASLQEAENANRKYQPDICLLAADDENNAQSSLAFAKAVKQTGRTAPFIFLVASSGQDVPHDKFSAFAYSSVLNKDLSGSRLLQSIRYALLQVENSRLVKVVEDSQRQAMSTPASPSLQRNNNQLFFKIGDSFRGIEKAKIGFFFAENKLTYARVGKRNFPTNVQLKTLEAELAPSFLRCHKKYLVNIAHIESVSTKDDKIKVDDELLPIGYSYRKSLLKGLNLLR